MPDITYRHQLQLVVGKTPTSGTAITNKDFEINPPEILEISDYNEDILHRFSLPASSADYAMPLGLVALAKLLIIKPEADLELKLVNNNGTSQSLLFKGGRTSVVHLEFTGMLATNSSLSAVKGVYFLAGD